MSLLTIAQNVALEAGFPEPSSLVGNTDDTARRIRVLAEKEVRQLSRWRPWHALRKTHTFTTKDGTATYALPGDFRYLLNRTAWDRTRSEPLHGPTSPQRWQWLVSGTTTPTTTFWFRIRGSELELYPTPSSKHDIAYDYLSNAPVDTDADGVGDADTFKADHDSAVIDERLIELGVTWRLLKAVGAPYQEEFNEYQRAIARAHMHDGGAEDIAFIGTDNERPDPADIFDDAIFSSAGDVITVR